MEINYRMIHADSDSEIIQWLELYRVCYHHEMNREFWNWIHIRNPFYKKTKPLVFIAEVNDRIIGSLSLIPSPIKIQTYQTNVTVNSCLVCKAMVHPQFRNHGIFRKLLQHAIKTAGSEGFEILLTISNNQYSYQGFVKTGFHEIAIMRLSTIYLFIDEIFSEKIHSLKIPKTAGQLFALPLSCIYSLMTPHPKHNLQIKSGDIASFYSEIENFHTSSRLNQDIYGIRTASFIEWRFSRPGTRFHCLTLWKEHQMLGYIIVDFLQGTRNALIADLHVRDDDESLIAVSVSEAILYCKKYRFHLLSSYTVETGRKFGRFFSLRNGFLRHTSNDNQLPQSRLLYYPLNDKLNSAILSDKNNWNIQAADTCLFG